MDNNEKAVLVLNEKEHAEMVQNLEATRDFLSSTIEMMRDREAVLQTEYESLMAEIEMTEESLLNINNVLFEICVP